MSLQAALVHILSTICSAHTRNMMIFLSMAMVKLKCRDASPPSYVVSQLELIWIWEKKTALPDPENIPVSILHSVFVKGVTMNFELGDNDIEASRLYPDMQFATVEQLLDVFLHDPPKSASAAFA
ncbi:hypothetical protein RJ639_000614 [Escallonia herrerae]|uniref:Uncharacterized protein n=1 Tax=Escallonia herrerae TaxID=1293975 RepID=A0AA88XK57_9ASTE|nr:hypothetical protein RJ639_000614 [Escallonia herrerae]